jgi:hypothetical protein
MAILKSLKETWLKSRIALRSSLAPGEMVRFPAGEVLRIAEYSIGVGGDTRVTFDPPIDTRLNGIISPWGEAYITVAHWEILPANDTPIAVFDDDPISQI